MKTLVSFSDIKKITMGDEKVMRDLLAVFLKQNTNNLAHLQELHKKQDWDALKKAAHKLKSSLALVGLPDQRGLAEKLERTAGNDLAETTELVHSLAATLKQVLAEVETKLKEIS